MTFAVQAKVSVIALVSGLCLAGCSKTDSSESAAKTGSSGGQPGAMSFKRVIQRPNVIDELGQLGLYYHQYRGLYNRSPAKLDDLQTWLQRDMPKLYQGIKDEYYVVFWGVPTPSSNVVLAHEKDADANGFRIVLLGDGSVQRMNETEFQQSLNAK